MQFVPEDWVYTYFRYDNNQTVMVVMNTAGTEKTINLERFAERTSPFSRARNVVTNATPDLKGEWTIPARTAWVLNLEK